VIKKVVKVYPEAAVELEYGKWAETRLDLLCPAGRHDRGQHKAKPN
jgi:hypothetical protein